MTFYLQTYPFGFAQDRPYRRMARRWVENRDQTLGINVREEQDVYVLSALVPGIKSDELNIQILEDVVQIKAEYQADENNGYIVHELPGGSFTRTLRLPAAIDTDRVEANITDGVLTLKLPKAESARPKQIKIKSR
ncbi:MAG: Hsp20/alpha crystallin family protein [Chloroflexi bacterium]|nr:MAG: Hsp20/alpha crystallin family protein [Chloroflexota bacterium]